MAASHRPKYRLAAHVGACRTGDYLVLLDCRNARYLGLPALEAAQLAAHIAHWPWPTASAASEDGHTCPDTAELLDQLLRHQLITDSASTQVSASSVTIGPPEAELIEGYEEVRYSLTPRDISRFVRATLSTLILLRTGSLESLAARIRSRRSRAVTQRFDSATGLDADRVRALVMKFERLSRLVFTRHDTCLFRSVALFQFLSYEGIFPYCVFGVTTNPFNAHCWLQQGNLVLNDSCSEVSQYTPILVL